MRTENLKKVNQDFFISSFVLNGAVGARLQCVLLDVEVVCSKETELALMASLASSDVEDHQDRIISVIRR